MSQSTIGLFCFDGPLYKDRNGNYCSTTLTNEMFNRFFSVVSYLYIVVRSFDSNKTCDELNMKKLMLDHMEVIEVENLVSPKGVIFDRPKFEKNITNLIEKVDLIFARMPSVISNSVLKIALKKKKPYLVEVGGCAWDSYWNHGIAGKVVAPIMYLGEKKYVKHADFATYVTKEFLQKRYPNNNVSTNCSNVYLKRVNNSILENRLARIQGFDMTQPVIGQAVASVDVRYKGEHFIIKAMGALKEKGILVRYEIVGHGNGDYIIEQAKKYGVEDQVFLLGAKKKEEIFDWLCHIDLYAQPSLQEGLPRSVIEAMSVGCPAIGSNIAGIPELLDDICLFNPTHNNEIVNVIYSMLNREVLSEQAKTNYSRAQEYNLSDIEIRRKKIFERYKCYVKEKVEI